MTTNTHEQHLKDQIRKVTESIKRLEKTHPNMVLTIEGRRNHLNYLYALLANEQDTTYPTL